MTHLERKLEIRARHLWKVRPVIQVVTRFILLFLIGMCLKMSCDTITEKVGWLQQLENAR